MNILALCSALNNTYLAFRVDGITYSEIIKSDENYHSLYLLPKIKEILDKNNIKLSDIDIIATNCGPGSFTGIRVSLTVAKTIAGELNLPIVPLNTAEILLTAFNKDVLIMDARRDMFFVGDNEKIELIYKDKIKNLTENKTILCDKRSFELFENAICFEEIEKDLGKTMLELAEKKYSNSLNKDEFEYLKIKANYIQTPPVF